MKQKETNHSDFMMRNTEIRDLILVETSLVQTEKSGTK